MVETQNLETAYLYMLVISIPTNITFTGNQTLTNLHVRGSVDIRPRRLSTETIVIEMKFCIYKNSQASIINIYIINHGTDKREVTTIKP